MYFFNFYVKKMCEVHFFCEVQMHKLFFNINIYCSISHPQTIEHTLLIDIEKKTVYSFNME